MPIIFGFTSYTEVINLNFNRKTLFCYNQTFNSPLWLTIIRNITKFCLQIIIKIDSFSPFDYKT